MKLFPAIDILDGRAVRLLYGDRNRVTVYGKPSEFAQSLRKEGAEYLHVVDLNGAFDGVSGNADVIAALAKNVHLPIQIGGGVRSIETIERYLACGVARVILGTVILTQPDFLKLAVKEFGADRIVCGIDARDGLVAIKGWVEQSSVTPIELGKRVYGEGVKTVVYTDISRDGALTGINTAACAELMRHTKLDVIASGGLKDLQDVAACAEARLYGAILGKALYEKKFTLPDALKTVREVEHAL